MAPTRQEIDQQLREGEKTLSKAQEESRRISEALTKSERVRREALPKLRAAGHIR